MSRKTDQLQSTVSTHIDKIKHLFTAGAQVSIAVHFPGDTEGRCDVLIGDIPDADLVALVQRFMKPAEPSR